MSERVQLLLSDRILGMTLVPEGKVWNYGIGLTNSWMPNLSYSMTLDTPLMFWAEQHRPQTFLTVGLSLFALDRLMLNDDLHSSPIWKRAMTAPMSRTALLSLYAFTILPLTRTLHLYHACLYVCKIMLWC